MRSMQLSGKPLTRQWQIIKTDAGFPGFFFVEVLANLAGFKAHHMNFDKENFVRTILVSLLQKLINFEPGRWGKDCSYERILVLKYWI